MHRSATIDLSDAIDKTKDIRDRVSGNHPSTHRALVAVGEAAVADVKRDVMRSSSPGGSYTKLGFVTVIMRRQGGKKIKDDKDVKALRNKAKTKPLQDTRHGLRSLQRGEPGNVFEVGKLFVRVGTNVSHFAAHQKKHRSSPFQFDEARFERNVRKTSPGKKSKTTKGGRRSRAKKKWNPFFFRMRGALRKMQGKSFDVKARPIIQQRRIDDRTEKYVRLFERTLFD